MAGPVVTTLLGTNPSTGSLTTDGTEQTFDSGSSVSGTFLLRVDTNAMVDGDQIEIRVYTKAAAGGTERQTMYYSMANAQGDPIHMSPPVPTAEDIKFTIKRVAGSDHAYPWSILNLNGV